MSSEAPGRIASLDAFRGFAIASMVLVNNPGDWGHLYAPLEHAKWDGWTFTDLVFPFFLFAAGVSMAVSLDRRRRVVTPGVTTLSHVAKRAAVILVVGLLLNLFPSFSFETVRFPGVLQRIALCILIAAPLAIWLRFATIAIWIFLIALAYTFVMLVVPVPDPHGVIAAGVLLPGRDYGAWLDRHLFGVHLWSQSKTWDPEGLVSTLPAVCSLLFGVLAGRWLMRAPATLTTSGRLLVAGLVALLAGLVLDRFLMPINKNLWTPSYAVFMTGWSLVVFAGFHAAMDARTFGRRPLLPLTIYGMNALFIFAFSGFVARLLIMGDTKHMLYAPIQVLPISPENASLLFAIGFNMAMFAVAWFMWKKKWFIRA
ncbi:MAG: heparan-alpha-glucosaminide N-acetyltransferase domain-containing protein [Usitatibacter sp.]